MGKGGFGLLGIRRPDPKKSYILILRENGSIEKIEDAKIIWEIDENCEKPMILSASYSSDKKSDIGKKIIRGGKEGIKIFLEGVSWTTVL